MKFRKVVSLIELLAVTSLFSVGFSSWYISDITNTIDGTIKVENFINADDYIDITNFTFSKLAKEGFVNDETIEGNVGYLSLELTLDLATYNRKIGFVNNTLGFDLELNSDISLMPFNLINYYDDTLSTSSYIIGSNDAVNIERELVKTESTLSYYFDITSNYLTTQPEMTLKINYAFDVSSQITTSFEEDIYNVLDSKELSFNIVVALRSGE